MEQLRRLSVTAFSEQSKDNDSSEDVAELLCAIVDATVNILDAERVTLFMVGDDGTKLVGTAFANFRDMNRLNPATKNLKIVIDRNIGGWRCGWWRYHMMCLPSFNAQTPVMALS